MNNLIGGLGELEEDIMEVLWRRKNGTVREVLQLLQRKRTLAYTTVMTVMARLADKGLLRRQELTVHEPYSAQYLLDERERGRYLAKYGQCARSRSSSSFLYIPTATKEAWQAQHSRGLFEALLKKTGTLAVAQFVDVLQEKDHEALAELKSLLRKRT